MNRNRQALILGRNRNGALDGVVVLQMSGTAARLQAAVTRTRADMERRGLRVAVQLDGQPTHAGSKKRQRKFPRPSSLLH